MQTPDADHPPILALKPATVQRKANGAWASLAYDDVYSMPRHAVAESRFVFLEKNDLPRRFAQLWADTATALGAARFVVAELGFGTGLNFMQVLRLWRDIAAQHQDVPPHLRPRLFYISTEKHPLRAADLAAMHADWPELADSAAELQAAYPPLVPGYHQREMLGGETLLLLLGDAQELLPQLQARVDTWFLDGFSPAKNPGLWSEQILAQMQRLSAPDATVATFSAAKAVRDGLAAAGFAVEKVPGYGVKRKMLTARRQGSAAMPAARPRVAVIGAGIGGAAVARALARRGCAVTVFERHAAAAQEASGNPRGIIYPKLTAGEAPMGRLYRQAFCHATQLLSHLALPSWQACGVLQLDMDADEARRTDKIMALYDYPADFAARVTETPLGLSALRYPAGGMVDAAAFTQALLDHPNITYRFSETPQDAPVTGFDATVICAANACTAYAACQDLPLRPLRGQITALAATAASQSLREVLCHDGYLTPAVDGLHYAGATFQKEAPPAAHDHRGTPRDEDNIAVLKKTAATLPQLGFAPADIRFGRAAWRATTPDKLPMLGAVPESKNLYVACGFGAHGLTAAPLGGEIVAALICGDPLPVPLDLMAHLEPGRFEKRKKQAKSNK